MEITTVERVLTKLDYSRLFSLTNERRLRNRSAAIENFSSVLDEATLVETPQVAPTVVTMQSRIVLRDAGEDALRTVTLCYPIDANPAEGRLSVMSPLGMALIGLQQGDVAAWECPNGETRTATVEELQFQPEAAGDFLA